MSGLTNRVARNRGTRNRKVGGDRRTEVRVETYGALLAARFAEKERGRETQAAKKRARKRAAWEAAR